MSFYPTLWSCSVVVPKGMLIVPSCDNVWWSHLMDVCLTLWLAMHALPCGMSVWPTQHCSSANTCNHAVAPMDILFHPVGVYAMHWMAHLYPQQQPFNVLSLSQSLLIFLKNDLALHIKYQQYVCFYSLPAKTHHCFFLPFIVFLLVHIFLVKICPVPSWCMKSCILCESQWCSASAKVLS